MNQELQIGKYEFYPYEFSLDDKLDELLKERELLSLSQKERDKRLKEIDRKLVEANRLK